MLISYPTMHTYFKTSGYTSSSFTEKSAQGNIWNCTLSVDMMACVCNPSTLVAETGQPRLHSKFKRLCHGSKRDSSCNMEVLRFLSFSEIRSYIADFVLLCNLGASRTFDFPDSSSQELDSKPVPLYLCWGLNPGQRHVRLTLYQLNCTTSLGK